MLTVYISNKWDPKSYAFEFSSKLGLSFDLSQMISPEIIVIGLYITTLIHVYVFLNQYLIVIQI